MHVGPAPRPSAGRPTWRTTPCRSTPFSTSSTTTSRSADRLHRGGRQLRGRGGDPVQLNALDGADTDNGMPGRRPHRQRQHVHPARRHSADHADVPVPRARTRSDDRSSRPAARRRRACSTTSTPTACPTAWSSTPTATRRSTTSRPARWARRGATSTPIDYLVSQGLKRHHRGRRGARGQVRRRGRRTGPHQAIDCPVGAPPRTCTGSEARLGWLHLRRLPQDRRRRRGPRRRRDLGADAVGPAQALGRSMTETLVTRGDGALAGRPVVPRHAQRDPAGRPGRLRRPTAAPSGRSSPTAAWASSPASTAARYPVEDFTMPPDRPHGVQDALRHGEGQGVPASRWPV